jgi:hypothetical protein
MAYEPIGIPYVLRSIATVSFAGALSLPTPVVQRNHRYASKLWTEETLVGLAFVLHEHPGNPGWQESYRTALFDRGLIVRQACLYCT